MKPLAFVVSCEHGGRDVPPAYRALFAGQEAVLESHRGFDPGALELAKALAARLGVPCLATTVTRLLVDTNRSRGHRQLFSEWSRQLSEVERDAVLARYHAPPRRRVADAVSRALGHAECVLHLGIHSFTPVLGEDERRFDIGWLYDSRRHRERQTVDRLLAALAERRPTARQRRNAPYLGSADGLTTALRRRHGEDRYLGLELEINQVHPLGPRQAWRGWIDDLCDAVEAACVETSARAIS